MTSESLIKSIAFTMLKTIICRKNLYLIIAILILRKALIKNLRHCSKKMLINFLTTNKSLTLTLSYI